MSADLEYFRLCRATDPTYTMYNAYKEYLYDNFSEAEEIAQYYWTEYAYDDEVFDFDSLMELLSCMNTEDVFRLGVFASGYRDDEFAYGAPYFKFNGYGNIESVESYDYEDMVQDAAHEAFDMVVDGEIEISDELKAVLDIFGFSSDGASYNRKSKKASKKPAKKKQPGRR